MWVFLGSDPGTFTATAHDGYSVTPYVPELSADLGEPLEDPRQRGNGWSRRFTGGWAAVNLNSSRRRKVTFRVPAGLRDMTGAPVATTLTLDPHNGAVFLA